jgi:sulfur carrier protein ThiS
MSDSDQRPRHQHSQQSEEWPERMKLSLAHKFLGVSHAKLTSLVNTGVIPHERDPLDHRVKLVRRSDLEKLRVTPPAGTIEDR